MQRKLTLALGVLFLVTLGMIGHLMWRAEHAAAGDHRRFFRAVESGRATEVLDLFDESFRDRIDVPALAAWVEAAPARFGRLVAIEKGDFRGRRWVEDGAARVATHGTARFERGAVWARIEYRDGRIVDLEVEVEGEPVEWLR
jgi:hypothetical protein